MTASMRVYDCIVIDRPGDPASISGSMNAPSATVTISGEQMQTGRRITIPKGGEPVRVWSYEEQPAWTLLRLRLLSGYLYCAKVVDKPTNADSDPPDYTPLGTHVRARPFDLTCKVPLTLNTQRERVNPTIADEYQLDGNGVPLIFADAGTVEGRIYHLWASNPDPDNDVILIIDTPN